MFVSLIIFHQFGKLIKFFGV